MAFRFDAAKVSMHAVVRYVQRIKGVELPLADEALSPIEDARRHAAAIGSTILDVKRLIYTPATAAAIEHGFNQANVGDVHLMFRDGRVVTVVGRTLPRPSKHALRILTEAEARRSLRKINRRHKLTRLSAPPTEGEEP